MFGSKSKKKAAKIAESVSAISRSLAQNKALCPNGINEQQVETVLMSVAAFYVAGFVNDFDLTQKLLPAYQKRIMSQVTRDEYYEISDKYQNYYTIYRDAAIIIQSQHSNVDEMTAALGDKFSALTLKNLNLNRDDLQMELVSYFLTKVLEAVAEVCSAQ